MPVTPIDTDQIVITASRVAESEAQTPASVTIIDQQRIDRLGEPLVPALLRLVPSAAVATSGPGGSLTEVRIRGAEANHTLLFIDGIAVNDPASGNAPRFELLNADLVSRVEVVRGPQSALWGSEAIGGVVAVNGIPDAPGYSASAGGGSFGFRRASASGAVKAGSASLAGGVGWQRAVGIDSVNGEGDKDGYRNLSGRLRGTWAVAPSVELGVAVLAMTGRSEFDGFNPAPPFQHEDTLDSSRNRLAAGRLWTQFGDETSSWKGLLAASALGSTNRNLLAGDDLNRTKGIRQTLSAQVERGFATGAVTHTLIGAVDAEWEGFHARDFSGGFTNTDRTRRHQALTLEWRGKAKAVTGDIALRRDIFNRFRDATSLRASLLADIGGGFAVAGSYAEGIAQPTFFDLFGFFPGFIGNPSLKAESSRGFEASLRFRRGAVEASLTGYRQRLHDEIVPTADFSSTTNRDGTSHRSGIEAELGWKLGEQLRLNANYAFLNATELDSSGARQIREARRPKHSGSIALDGVAGSFSYGASLAYVGAHLDNNFDVFPSQVVRLDAYWLANARAAYALRPNLDLFARASNLFDSRYQDVFGYRTEGRGLYAGIRLASRR
jgi:vitamin B12 transporter